MLSSVALDPSHVTNAMLADLQRLRLENESLQMSAQTLISKIAVLEANQSTMQA